MDKYLRIFWPDYQPLMEEHKNEWSTEVGIINDSDGVLVPIEWWEEHRQKLMDEKFILVEKRLKEYFKETYIESFHLNMRKSDWIDDYQFIIYPTEPEFDEDYNGLFDGDIGKIGDELGVDLSFTGDIYGK
jgi:hypothetical protein